MGSGGNANIPTIRGAMRHEGGNGRRGRVIVTQGEGSGERGNNRGIPDIGES